MLVVSAALVASVGCNSLLDLNQDFVLGEGSGGAGATTGSGTSTGSVGGTGGGTSTGTAGGTGGGTGTGSVGGTGGGTSTGTAGGTGGTGSGGCTPDITYFSEDFGDNSQGWTLGTEWEIGSAAPSTCQEQGNSDPAADHSPTADNGVAGVVLGGCYSTDSHAYYELTSPVVDLSAVSGPVHLSYWRWLNGGVTVAPKQMISRVSVYNESTAAYTSIWQVSGEVTDADWTSQYFDVTAFKSANFRIKFAFAITGGGGSAAAMSGFNVDDVLLWSGTCN